MAPLTGGIEASGWKLVYRDEPNAYEKAQAKDARGGASFIYSLGINLDKSGSAGEVRWDSPAFDAGVGTGMSVVAVNDIAYGKEVLEDARSEEHTSELQSLMRISYADFCLKK